MSGVGKFHAHEEYKKVVNYIKTLEDLISKNQYRLKNLHFEPREKVYMKKELAYIKKLLAEYKTHARELKKLL
jgi:hypothetical protein